MSPGTELFEEWYEQEKLGGLSIEIPLNQQGYDRMGRLSLDLDSLYEALSEDDGRPDYDSVVTACIIGSAIYDDNGKERMPEDLDVFVVHEGGEGSVVVPEKYVSPEVERRMYGRDTVKGSAVYTEVPVDHRSFLEFLAGTKPYGYRDDALPLHMVYRSVEQFVNGVEGDGRLYDSVSRTAYREGVPIIGEEGFEQVVYSIDTEVPRDPSYEMVWKESDQIVESYLRRIEI